MASLAIGVAGAAVGSFFGPLGASIGWALGAALGNALFPNTPPPQRLHDLHLQGSSYGAFLKIVYGTVRVAGSVIWETDLQEHSGGGKGKGGGGQASYTASFDVALTETKVKQIRRIWAGGRLNYDVSQSGGPKVPFVFYDGNVTQLPDPTEEAHEGAGNVPAYRGISRVVFTDWDMTQFGNTLPQLSFELVTASGNIPWRVSTWTPPRSDGVLGGASMLEGPLTIGTYTEADDAGPPSTSTQSYIEYTFDTAGIQLSATSPVTLTNQPSSGSDNRHMFANPFSNAQAAFCHLSQQGGNAYASSWYLKNSLVAWPVAPAIGTDSFYAVQNFMAPFLYTAPDPFNSKAFAIGGSTANGIWVARYAAPNGVPQGGVEAYYAFTTAPGLYQVTVSNDDFVYVLGPSATVAGHTWAMAKFDLDLNLIHQWNDGDLPAVAFGPTRRVTVYNGMVLIGTVAGNAELYRINGDNTFTFVGTTPCSSAGSMITLGNGLVITEDGLISLIPPPGTVTLASVVADLCDRAGLSGQYDVSALVPIIVDGYIVEAQTTARAAIEALMPIYFFDAVESDGVVKFVLRGGTSVVTFLDDDLAAHMDHDNLPSILSCVHTPDADLPSGLAIAYLNKDGDYQINTQISQRMIGGSRDVRTVSVPIVLTDDHAKKIVDSWLYNTWSERDAYTWYSSRKYAAYEPTDVCVVQGKTLRITKKLEGATGVIKWEGVLSRGANFSQAGVGGDAKDPGQTLPVSQASQCLLLDIPLVDDADAPGFYVAAAGATSPSWAGMILYQSIDGGTTWTSIATIRTASVIGTTTTVLPNFAGNVFDEGSTLDVVIGAGGGTLSSVTAAAALGGAGAYLIGNEIVYAKNAVLLSASNYRLSGMLRGRRGTEAFTGTHVAGERFVKLPVTDVAMPTTQFYHTYSYRAVTIGRPLSSAATQTFANTGNALKCYSPTDVGGGCDASGNVTINWKRRTRVGGAWVDYVDVPLSEATEAYIVQIWDASYTVCARVISGLTTQTCTYTAAQQTTDFGAVQQHVYFTVGQLGAFTLGAQTRGIAPSTGGSDGVPLVPVPPYVAPPLIPPPGGTAPVDIALTWPSDSRVVNITIGQRKVCSFTTGGSIPLTGTISVAEAAAAGTPRRCFISTDSGGLNVVPHSLSYGVTATSFIGAASGGAILAASTTYYYTFDFQQPDGSLSGPPGFNAQTILSLGNVT